jgi:hypothetical protein
MSLRSWFMRCILTRDWLDCGLQEDSQNNISIRFGFSATNSYHTILLKGWWHSETVHQVQGLYVQVDVRLQRTSNVFNRFLRAN